METFNQDQLSALELKMDTTITTSLHTTAKWTKFLAVLLFISAGLLLIFLLVMSVGDSSYQLRRILGNLAYTGDTVMFVVAVFAIVTLIFGIMGYFLLSFSKKTKSALVSENIEELNSGLRSLKISFVLYGVIAVLSLLASLFTIAKIF